MSRTSPDRPRILLGAMSGTSADGVDVAAVEITGRGIAMKARYLAHVEHPYDPNLRQRIFALREGGQTRLDELASLGRGITLAYAVATRELLERMSLRPSQVEGLAAHGQTLYHAPPESIQWLDPSLLAAETDLPVVSDFRRADLAAGGQGAPLVPFADWILFRHAEKTRVILNIGGIANLTYLPAGGGIEDVIAFDTGPGMCISDWAVRTWRGEQAVEGPGYDEGGQLARLGLPAWSEAVFDHPFFRTQPPRSTDGPQMIAAFLDAKLELPPKVGHDDAGRIVRHPAENDSEWKAACWASTGVDLCAIGVQRAIRRYLPQVPHEIVLGGGGAKNGYLVERLDYYLTQIGGRRERVLPTTTQFGLPAQAREAVAFAILGAATIDNEPSNVPAATGARRRVVLGSITPRPGQ